MYRYAVVGGCCLHVMCRTCVCSAGECYGNGEVYDNVLRGKGRCEEEGLVEENR